MRAVAAVLSLAACGFACEAPVDGLGGLGGEGAVRAAALPDLAGHWMLPIIADNHNGEHWWSFDAAGALQAMERRVFACCRGGGELEEGGEIVARALDASGSVDDRVVSVRFEERGVVHTERFSAALLEPASFARAYAVPEWLPWADELEPDGRLLTDRAFFSEDETEFRGERHSGWQSPDSGPNLQEAKVLLRFDRSLTEAIEDRRCSVEVEFEITDGVEEAQQSFQFDCVIRELEGEEWTLIQLDERAWWEVVESLVPRELHSTTVISIAKHALASKLYVHASSPNVLLAGDAELRYGMAKPPVSLDP